MSDSAWLATAELRVGLGCMRLSTDTERDERVSRATIAAAVAAGITVFDTAHAYGHDATEAGHNERLLARTLRDAGAPETVRIVTKCGMTRTGGGWTPDGRSGAILADCEASLAALDGLPIDLLLVHAPDPRTPWRTTVRALTRVLDEGLARRVGLSNVNRSQLDEALDLVDVAAVQVALGVHDVSALRGGLVEYCAGRGIAVIAHSPLGGPRRAGALARNDLLAELAGEHDATAAEVAIAWLLALSPAVAAVPGARTPATAVSSARAAALELAQGERERLNAAFGVARAVRPASRPADSAEIVIVMGIPGAGKSRAAQEYVARGYRRLNRDERGGTLRALADTLESEISSGVRHVVLDNTYLTRATRSYVLEVAHRHGIAVRCVWIDTPLAHAQVNMVERLLDRFGALPEPAVLQAMSRQEPGLLMPTQQMRALRELEPPADDEGFARVERVPFVRASGTFTNPGFIIAADALARPDWQAALGDAEPEAPHLIFNWMPGGDVDSINASVARAATEISGHVDGAVCVHPGGPPACWCRPPLPGLILEFARAHEVDTSRSVLVGTSPAHRTLATTLGARYVAV